MRVLLDENVDRKLKRSFDPEHEVKTVLLTSAVLVAVFAPLSMRTYQKER